ncbi:MAG TPA: hypothetical protein VK875_00590 [Euzebyales bacterium]|nr:hypothetical protein [Euzebyales bacterium]
MADRGEVGQVDHRPTDSRDQDRRHGSDGISDEDQERRRRSQRQGQQGVVAQLRWRQDQAHLSEDNDGDDCGRGHRPEQS